MKQRDNYYSFMKGLAIIAVLFIHTPFMSDGAAGIASRQLFTFAVALFFFLSGYFIRDEYLDTKSIMRIFIPYAIWSLLWFSYTTLKGSQPVTTWKIVNTLFFGGAFFPLYFLIVLIELKIISPWIVRHIRKVMNGSSYKAYKDWALLISPITLFIMYFIQYCTHQQPLIYAQIFPIWFLFYYIGAVMKFGGFIGNTLKSLCFTLLGIYLMGLESTYINEVIKVPFWAASQIKFSSYFYSLSFCILLMSMYRKVERDVIVRLGEMSFGIYLLHIPIMKGVTYALSSIVRIVGISNSSGVLIIRQITIVVLTLLFCYIVLVITNRYLPSKINRY